MRLLGSTAALLVLALAGPSHALDPARPIDQYSRTAWQMEQGLPQSTVQAIRQTRDGYLWVGTAEGLARFDGQRFTVFGGETPALGVADIQFLHEARDGSLYMGAYGAGLVRLRDGVFQRVTPARAGELEGLAAIAEDRAGTLWTGGDDGRLYRVTAAGPEAVAIGGDGAAIRALHVDHAGRLWIGTTSGLGCLASGVTSWLAEKDGLASAQVTALAEDAHGRLWVGTSRGLAQVESGRVSPAQSLLQPAVRTLVIDGQGTLWVGSDAGLTRIRGAEVSHTLGGAEGLGAVRALAEDRDGSLWVGTFSDGLSELKDGALVTYTRSHGLVTDGVGSVTPASKGGLWLALGGGVIQRFFEEKLQSFGTPGANGAAVSALYEDRSGVLWAGTELGLARLDPSGWRRLGPADGMPGGSVNAIGADRLGRLWVGLDGAAAVRIDNGRGRPLPRSLIPSEQVRVLLESRDGRMLVGTYDGLVIVEGEHSRLYTTKDGLSSNLIRALHEDRDGVLWIGTYGGGVTRMKGGALKTIRQSQGLFSDIVYAIVEDGAGRLWMSCNRGVFSVAKSDFDAVAEGRAPRVRSNAYGRSDGMLSVECNGGAPGAARTADGRLWFATEGGLVGLDPSSARRGHARPTPRLDRTLVDGQPVAPGPVVLSPGARRVRFEYASPDFRAPERLRYAHRLEGFDAGLLDVPRYSAEYTNLPAGEYRFVVRVTDEDGGIGETAVPLRVRAAWYRTRGFAIACVALLAAAVFGGYRVRVRSLRASEAQLKKRVEEAVAEVRVLSGLLPICSGCKKIRDDKGDWTQIESYIAERVPVDFSHGICPDCARALYPGLKSTR